MKSKLLLIILLAMTPWVTYSQEELAGEDQNFHFIEAGIGGGHGNAAFTVAMSNGLGKYMANFLDYNLYFDKSSTRYHEISFKIGPYYQINRYSYVALSAGVSMFINATGDNWVVRNGLRYYENDYQLNIPVQAKMNVDIYKGLCFGLKGTINKMVDKHNSDRGSILMYLGWGW